MVTGEKTYSGNGGKGVTMMDIADRLGVSKTTVSKALRGMPGIGTDTIEQVCSLAEQLGYRPNVYARSLANCTSTAIGLLITSNITYPWYAQLVSQFEEEFRSRGYTLMLGIGKNEEDNERHCLEAFMGGHVAGIIAGPVFHHHNTRPLIDVMKYGPPLVLFSCLEELPVNYVAIDHVSGVKTVIDYLVSLGHRRIGYLCCSGSDMRVSNSTRKDGFEAGMFANDLPLYGKDIVVGMTTFRAGFSEMSKLLEQRRDDLPTAFFCHNDAVALGALQAIRNAGLRVPDDISLVGYDDIEEAAFSVPALTTMGGIMDKLTNRLVEVLMSQIKNPTATPTREKIIPQLIERESVAKIKV